MLTQDAAREELRRILRPGRIVYTVLRHVSRSGMSRSISVVVANKRDELSDVSWLVARAGLGKFDRRHDGVKVNGCGMDMGFHLVYSLSRVLYPNGHRCAGKRCQSNDHSNPPHPPRDGRRKHRDGGYALDHRWL